MGSGCPVRIQSMTNTPTLDVEATLNQLIRIIDAGADLVRITTPSLKEAKAMVEIHRLLRKKGYNTPLVADVHFNPKVAEFLAPFVEKIRINPGNFADKTVGTPHCYTEQAYQDELFRIETRFSTLVELCKKHHTAMRIGVNHGSLSSRILNRYGDTPEGMAQSAMEFLRIGHRMHYDKMLVSMKSSDVKTMIYATRLLVMMMEREDMRVPVHLGVTEAGSDAEGRIRSTAGMAPLLLNGIGDTIRVSLTENPESEIPVARKMLQCFPRRSFDCASLLKEAVHYEQKAQYAIGHIGRGRQPLVVLDEMTDLFQPGHDLLSYQMPWITAGENKRNDMNKQGSFFLCPVEKLIHDNDSRYMIPVVEVAGLPDLSSGKRPVILQLTLDHIRDNESFMMQASGILSTYLVNGIGNGIWIKAKHVDAEFRAYLSFAILQACGLRRSQTEYISCPTCGRTKFDMQKAVCEVKRSTSHLKHLKIAIMGCIVNGPGEMSDADYGYIGAGAGKVSLFKGKKCIRKNVEEGKAADALIALIKENGDWRELPDSGG